MKPFKNIILPVVALALLAGCKEDTSNKGAQVPSQEKTEKTLSGIYCSGTKAEPKTLVIYQDPASPFLNFSFSAWNEDGQNCGKINALANKSTQGEKWVYSTKTDDGMQCELSVGINSDGVTITETNSGCSPSFCGAGFTIGTLNFPYATKLKEAVRDDIDTLYEKPPCPEKTQ